MKTIDDYTISDIRALINDRDALVAMNAELVEALELAVQSMLDSGYRVNSSFIRSLSSALAKAKELSHEG